MFGLQFSLRSWILRPVLNLIHNSQLALHERLDMDQQDELAALTSIDDSLGTVAAILVKGLGEITDEIANLQANIPPGATTAIEEKFTSIQAKVAAVLKTAQALDDLNPDPTTITPAPPPADPLPVIDPPAAE